jgi:hypothetical protein
MPLSRLRLATPSPALWTLHVLQTSRSATHCVRTRLRAPLITSEDQQGLPRSHVTVNLHRQLLELHEPQALTPIESPNKPLPTSRQLGREQSASQGYRPFEAAILGQISLAATPSENIKSIGLSGKCATAHRRQQLERLLRLV